MEMSEISDLKPSYLEPNIPSSNNSNFCSRQKKKTQNAEEKWRLEDQKTEAYPASASSVHGYSKEKSLFIRSYSNKVASTGKELLLYSGSLMQYKRFSFKNIEKVSNSCKKE